MSRFSLLCAALIAVASFGHSTVAAASGGSHAHLATHGADQDVESHGAEGHHAPQFSDINWHYGFIGEKEGVEPGLLWRPPGTPVPLLALFLNTAILFFLIGRFGGPGISKGLVDRRKRIAGDIEQAARMKEEAEDQLAHYEDKLEQVQTEMARIKAEMKEQAEADRVRILDEAKERRVVIEEEARQLIAQELAQARYDVTVKAIGGAVEAARTEIQKAMGPPDNDRLAKDFLSGVVSNIEKAKEIRS